MDHRRPSPSEQAAEARAGDRPGGHQHDAGPGADIAPAVASDPVGGSGHVPLLEESNPGALEPHSASPGADADRLAAEGRG